MSTEPDRLADAVRQLTRLVLVGSTVRSYAGEFGELWELSPETGKPMDGTWVVVWDGRVPGPEGKVDLARYLTPIDWAVGLSVAAADRARATKEPPPDLRVLIVDGSGRDAAGPAGRFVRRLSRGEVPGVPWVRVYRPSEGGPRELGLADLLADLGPGGGLRTLRACQAEDGPPDLDVLRRVWVSALARPEDPGDHHALHNVLGPVLLGVRAGDIRVAALRRLLGWLGIPPRPSARKGGAQPETTPSPGNFPWANWSAPETADPLGQIAWLDPTPLRVVLVDDQSRDQHWAEVLCRALGAEYTDPGPDAAEPVRVGKGTFGPIERPIELQVEAVSAVGQWLRNTGVLTADAPPEQRFGFGGPTPIDILFLDLRLHQGASLWEEAGFFLEVVKAAEGLAGDLPWPRPAPAELAAIRTWAERARGGPPDPNRDDPSRDDPEYVRALTLLPRLLAQIDCSLPIILFSSTGQRAVADALRPFRTVITAFEKPRLFGGATLARPDEVGARFQDAVAAALRLVEARRLCRKLPTADTLPDRLDASQDHGDWRVEVYLDESGRSGFGQGTLTVGGLVAVFPPDVSPEAFDDDLANAYPELRGHKDRARAVAAAAAAAVQVEAEACGVFLAGVALTGGHQDAANRNYDSSDVLSNETVADNLHRELLRAVTEIAVYVLARRVLPAGVGVRFVARAATRVLPLVDDAWQYLTPAQRNENVKQMERARDDVYQYWGVRTVRVGEFAPLWDAHDELKQVVARNAPPAVMGPALQFVSEMNKVEADPAQSMGYAQQWFIRYFGEGDFRPLVDELVRQYRGGRFDPKPEVARAFPLNTHGTRLADDIPALHFLADTLPGRTGPAAPAAFRDLFGRGLVGGYGPLLVRALRANRLACQGLVPQALVPGATAWAEEVAWVKEVNDRRKKEFEDRRNPEVNDRPTEEDPNRILRAIACDLRAAAGRMTGTEFGELADLLRAWRGEPSEAALRAGEVCQVGRDFVRIRSGQDEFQARSDYCEGFTQLRLGDRVEFRPSQGRRPEMRQAKAVRKVGPAPVAGSGPGP